MSICGFIKKKLLFCISVMVIVLASGGVKLCASDVPNYKEGEIIVKYKQGSVKPQNSVFFTDACNDMEYIDEEHSYYYINNSDMEDVLEKCNNDPDIEYAQPNYKYSMKYVTSDPYLAYEWGLDKINVHKVWDLTKEEETPIIAIVDTGVNAEHLDLKGNILKGYNVIDGTTDVKDECGHGTHIAGIAAAITNNETGIAGVSGNSKILPVKVLDGYGNGYSSDIAIGIKWAADKGAKIINLSLGGTSYDNYLKEAVEYATNKGCIIVAAAGNKGTHRPTYPAAFENVVAVTAVDNNNKLCNFSNLFR